MSLHHYPIAENSLPSGQQVDSLKLWQKLGVNFSTHGVKKLLKVRLFYLWCLMATHLRTTEHHLPIGITHYTVSLTNRHRWTTPPPLTPARQADI